MEAGAGMANEQGGLTPKARDALAAAQEEARRLSHAVVGMEHVLLGILRDTESIASRALKTAGVDLEAARKAVEAAAGRGQEALASAPKAAAGVKELMDAALREAQELKHQYIGTEHFLLAIVREGEGRAAGVLKQLGAGLERVREEVGHLVQREPRGGGAG